MFHCRVMLARLAHETPGLGGRGVDPLLEVVTSLVPPGFTAPAGYGAGPALPVSGTSITSFRPTRRPREV
jgi:hypothetical protein